MRSGQVVTFYSYKGGVGRSMALANCGVLLASWGFKVLLVDWDLEAPGLNFYFAQDKCAHTGSLGLIDLLLRPAARMSKWTKAVSTFDVELQNPGRAQQTASIDIIYSAQGGRTANQLRTLDWSMLFTKQRLAERLEQMRHEWRQAYDFVLLDSRTGITDVGGICTVQLPDLIVLLSTASHQSLDGILDVAKRAQEARDKLPFDRGVVPLLPILTRVETTVEYQLQQEWLTRFSDAVQPLISPWLHRDISSRAIAEQLRIPHVAYWSYGERIAVSHESASDTGTISFAYEALAAAIARRLDRTDLLVGNRADYVQGARELGSRPIRSVQHWLYISAARRRLNEASRLLNAAVASVDDHCFFDIDGTVKAPPNVPANNDHPIAIATHVILLIDDQGITKSQLEVLSMALRRMARSADDPGATLQIRVVVLAGAEGKELHPAIASFPRTYLTEENADQVIHEILSPRNLTA